MAITLRVATGNDALDLSRFAAAVFRHTFAEANDPADLEKYLAEAFSEPVLASAISDPRGVVLLAEDHVPESATTLVGYAHLFQGEVPRAVHGPAPIELKRLYVAHEWHGRGVAQALMNGALHAAGERGARTIWLGVWERNPRAIAFYAKHGFRPAGQHIFMLGNDRQTDWILVKSLDR